MCKGRVDKLTTLTVGIMMLKPMLLLAQTNTAHDHSVAIGQNGDYSPVTIIEQASTADRRLQRINAKMQRMSAQLAIVVYNTNPKRKSGAIVPSIRPGTQISDAKVSSRSSYTNSPLGPIDGQHISATQISAIYDRAQDDLGHGRFQSFEENLRKACNLHDDTACDQLSEEYILGYHLKISLNNACMQLEKSKSFEAKYLIKNCIPQHN